MGLFVSLGAFVLFRVPLAPHEGFLGPFAGAKLSHITRGVLMHLVLGCLVGVSALPLFIWVAFWVGPGWVPGGLLVFLW